MLRKIRDDVLSRRFEFRPIAAHPIAINPCQPPQVDGSQGLDRDFHYRSPARRIKCACPPLNATGCRICTSKHSHRPPIAPLGSSRDRQRSKLTHFRPISATLHRPVPPRTIEIRSGRRLTPSPQSMESTIAANRVAIGEEYCISIQEGPEGLSRTVPDAVNLTLAGKNYSP